MLSPETEPQAGHHRLSMALSSLRHQLEPPGVLDSSVLQADRFSVRLNPAAITTDVAEFEEVLHQNDLQRAIGLYRSPLLPGYYSHAFYAGAGCPQCAIGVRLIRKAVSAFPGVCPRSL